MRKFKLIKEYPGSPKLGTVVVDTNISNGAKDGYFSENWAVPGRNSAFKIGKQHKCESQPEFWKEVIEKDYEIIEIITNVQGRKSNVVGYGEEYLQALLKDTVNVKIYSIKRLSDGEVLTVGDKIKSSLGGSIRQITEFNISDHKYPEVLFGSCWGQRLNNVEKVKQPLFITEDGVDIFEGDECYLIYLPLCNTSNLKNSKTIMRRELLPNPEYRLVFSTKERAEKYILMNSPCLSINDVNELKCKVFSEWDNFLTKLVKSKL